MTEEEKRARLQQRAAEYIMFKDDYEADDAVALVMADSMSPTLNAGEYYYFEPVEASALREGDIILVNTEIDGNPTRVAHRIVSIETIGGELTFVLKGDNNELADLEQYTAEDVVGKLICGESGTGSNEGE